MKFYTVFNLHLLTLFWAPSSSLRSLSGGACMGRDLGQYDKNSGLYHKDCEEQKNQISGLGILVFSLLSSSLSPKPCCSLPWKSHTTKAWNYGHIFFKSPPFPAFLGTSTCRQNEVTRIGFISPPETTTKRTDKIYETMVFKAVDISQQKIMSLEK